jgi:hypothetical protein
MVEFGYQDSGANSKRDALPQMARRVKRAG